MFHDSRQPASGDFDPRRVLAPTAGTRLPGWCPSPPAGAPSWLSTETNAGAIIPTRSPSAPSRHPRRHFADPPRHRRNRERKRTGTLHPLPRLHRASEAIRQLILITAVATTSESSTGTNVGKEFAESSGLSGNGLAAPAVSVHRGRDQSARTPGRPRVSADRSPRTTSSSPREYAVRRERRLFGSRARRFFKGSDAGCRSFFRLEAQRTLMARRSSRK